MLNKVIIPPAHYPFYQRNAAIASAKFTVMRKLFIVLGCMAIMAISCQKEVQINKDTTGPVAQSRPVCGMEEAMARMTAEMREVTMTTSEGVQANELLLYLDFDGGIIRRGVANVTGTVSPILGNIIANCPAAPLTVQQKQELIDL